MRKPKSISMPVMFLFFILYQFNSNAMNDASIIKYVLSVPDPAFRFLEIKMHVDNINADKISFQLPAWRPGRYELGNFAKNVQRWKPVDEKGNALNFKKVTKDKWEVETKGISKVIVEYNFYSSQLDAGGCWVDNEQWYVNPVQCLMYAEGRKNIPCEVELAIPAGWQVATGMKKKDGKILFANNYDELADCPFIASPSLKHHSFLVNNIPFHIWMQGEVTPDFPRLEKDFTAFASAQIRCFGDMPVKEYHCLIQVMPVKYYHGVEHLNSTVLAIGPGAELMTAQYSELLGLASHELFHVWNVKTIRPAEMQPYDYTKENYSRLGYVYEGFTSYYGDLFLARSGYFNTELLIKELSARLQKHMDNPGRFNYSVAQSSFDTWLDGYGAGIPDRKTSIYDEGALIALMLDFKIRLATSSKKSLDDVMRILYNDFGIKNKGYTENDLIKICEAVSGTSMEKFFNEYVNKAVSYENLLSELLNESGLEIKRNPSEKLHERMGFKITKAGDKIASVAQGSPAALAGLLKDDDLLKVNGNKIENNIEELFKNAAGQETILEVSTQKKIRIVKLLPSENHYYDTYTICKKQNLGTKEIEFIKLWCERR